MISAWYSAVAKTCLRSADGVSTTIASRCSRQVSRVAARRAAKPEGAVPQSRSRFALACSTPRKEKPIRISTTWPGVVGPAHMRPKGRSVVGRM